MLRLFIALPLPAEVEHKLDTIIRDLKPHGRDVKWVPAANIHLTVKFLGDTDDKLVPKIAAEIDRIASGYAPFQTVIDRLGAFPNLRRPNVFWASGENRIENAIEPAVEMAREIDDAMHQFGYDREKRAFKAHLTLGRVRQGRRVDTLAGEIERYRFEPIPLTLDRLVLFKSTLTPQGAVYERLHTALLTRQDRFEG